MGKVRVLYVREQSDPFLITLINELSHDEYKVYILDLKNNQFIDKNNEKYETLSSIKNVKINLFNYLFRFIRGVCFLLKERNRKFDTIHILNVKRENFWLIPFFKKRSRLLYISVYGRSTFSSSKRFLFKHVFHYVDMFLFSNSSLMMGFNEVYKKIPPSKLKNLTLPLRTLSENENISLATVNNFISKYDIKPNLLNISCSSTIASYDQHFKIIDSIAEVEKTDNLQLFFLLTYGGNVKERKEILEYIDKKLPHFNKIIFSEYLNENELKIYRSLTDVYINMRTTDQLAGAIIESLYNEALLISADWLDYRTLDDLEVFYKKIKNFLELTEVLNNIQAEFDIFKNQFSKSNKERILNFFSLQSVMKQYHKIYQKSID